MMLHSIASLSQVTNPNQVKVQDALTNYFTILEKSIESRSSENDLDMVRKQATREDSIITILENLTGIKVDSTISIYASAKYLQESDINKWKSWTSKNRNLLVWDDRRNRLARLDRPAE